jgi:spore maturation protein CgeB
MVDAFTDLGIQVKVYNFWGLWEGHHNNGKISQEFLSLVREFKPHLIHMQLQFTGLIEAHVIAEARRLCPGVIITNWTGDVRGAAQPQFTNLSNAVDYSLISSTGQLRMYKDAHCHNVRYWQIGYNPKVNYPLNYTDFKYDVSFLGNNYGAIFPDSQLRYSAVNTLRTAFGSKFGLFGNGYGPPAPSVSPSESNEVYNQSLCTLSISNFNGVAHYFSDRFLHCVASGRPTISWHFPGFDSYFTEGKDIFIARSSKDIIDIVNRCKKDPEMARTVGINGYQKALAEHTFTSRVLELLDMTKLINMG